MLGTCDACRHWVADPYGYEGRRSCALALDANKYRGPEAVHNEFNAEALPDPPDRMMGWDGEGYLAGVFTGPKFGCIHWLAK